MGAIFLAFLALNVLFVRTAIWFVTGFVVGVALLIAGIVPDFSGSNPPLWLVVVLATLFVVGQYVYSRHRMNAALADQTFDADLTAFATRRAQQLDVPAPSVYVAEYERPNSMIYGSRRSATIVLTRGLVESADDATLDAVVAHELGHLKNGDLWLMTTLNALPILAKKLREWSPDVRESLTTGTGGRASLFVVIVAAVTIALAQLFRAASLLVFRLFSRYREYAADATAAELVGAPEQVAAALATLDEGHGTPDADARARAAELQQACFLPHGLGERTEDAGLDFDVSLQWGDDANPDVLGSGDEDDGGMNWDRIDEIESRNDDQPMRRLERQRAETESPTTWVRERFLPDTHPSTADRIERLQSLRE